MSDGNIRSNVSRMFMGLGVVYVTCLLLSNLIAGKLIAVGGLILPAAVILFPITYIFGDIFTEVYGFRNSRLVIWLGFACNLLAVGVYMLVVWLPHPEFWNGQDAYKTVFATTPRVLIASLAGYLFGEFSNSIILSKLKVIMNGKRLWVRTIGSTIVGEAFDTVIFITFVFWDAVPKDVLLQMILLQYAWKVVYEIILTPATYVAVRKLKRIEGVDVYDRGISYNIFK